MLMTARRRSSVALSHPGCEFGSSLPHDHNRPEKVGSYMAFANIWQKQSMSCLSIIIMFSRYCRVVLTCNHIVLGSGQRTRHSTGLVR